MVRRLRQRSWSESPHDCRHGHTATTAGTRYTGTGQAGRERTHHRGQFICRRNGRGDRARTPSRHASAVAARDGLPAVAAHARPAAARCYYLCTRVSHDARAAPRANRSIISAKHPAGPDGAHRVLLLFVGDFHTHTHTYSFTRVNATTSSWRARETDSMIFCTANATIVDVVYGEYVFQKTVTKRTRFLIFTPVKKKSTLTPCRPKTKLRHNLENDTTLPTPPRPCFYHPLWLRAATTTVRATRRRVVVAPVSGARRPREKDNHYSLTQRACVCMCVFKCVCAYIGNIIIVIILLRTHLTPLFTHKRRAVVLVCMRVCVVCVQPDRRRDSVFWLLSRCPPPLFCKLIVAVIITPLYYYGYLYFVFI